jgi:acid phosphatase
MWPLGKNATIDSASILGPNKYKACNNSMIYLTNGQAGNIESHSVPPASGQANITAFLDHTHYGFSMLNVHNATHTLWEFVHGEDGQIGDYVWIVKE